MNKKCGNCGVDKEATSQFFSKRKTSKDGFDRECKECKRKRDAKRYRKESKEILEQKRKYYQTNREKIINRQLGYYRKNKEKCHRIEKNWRKDNPLKRRLINEKRRTREAYASHTLTVKEWLEIKEYFDFSCAYCGISEVEHLAKIGERLHHEHVLPLVSGGTYDKNNVVPSCRSCNSSKANRNVIFWYPESKGYSEERLDKLNEFLRR